MKIICKDLSDEYEALDNIVTTLDVNGWQKETPFFGWTVKDEISHIAYFDQTARLSARTPEKFQEHFKSMMNGFRSFEELHEKINAIGGNLTNQELLEWWRKERRALLRSYEALHPKERLLWYGPTMSARSSATARLMETWAHGQDIVDAFHIKRAPTDRLKHIAHMGVATYLWSFKNRGLETREMAVRVELESPSGESWTWGDPKSHETVSGSALDFCLVVTQRRNVADTDIITTGDTAKKWMDIAQAFAGPPEDKPKPGKRTW